MGRQTFNLFFEPCAILCVTDRVNKIIQDNRKLDIMVESIGIFRHTLKLAKEVVDFSGDNELCIRAGRLIVRLSTDNEDGLSRILDTDDVLEYHSVDIFSGRNFPNEVFFDDYIDDDHIFIKKVKCKAITSGHLAEMEKAVIGVMQDTGHSIGDEENTSLARVDTLIAYYFLPDNYIVAIDDADVLGLRDVEMFPGLRITKINTELSMHISPSISDKDCLTCYILDNYMSWIIKLEAYNKMIGLIDNIDINGANVNVKLKLDSSVIFEKMEENEANENSSFGGLTE